VRTYESAAVFLGGYVSGADLLGDCYVVDQKMSAMNGLDLIAQLRDRHFTAPAILIASHPSRSLREQAENADIPIVEKPLLGDGLLDKIRDVVGGRA
jgi:FixJ family two-component response regulator